MSKLDALMKRHAQVSCKDFYRDGGLWSPLWLIENEDDKRLLLATPMDKDCDRDAYAQMVRGAIKEFGGVRYAYAHEAWFLQPPPGAALVRPSESPDRREAIFVMGEDINGDQACLMYEIKRPPNRKPFLAKAMVDNNADLSGRFSNMFSVGPYT